MEEIEVGEYVRTKNGYIEKIKEFIPHYTKGKRPGKSEKVVENYLLMGTKQCELIESIDYSIPPCYPTDEELEKIKKHIVKHSKNIIDLIEVGDYVNEYKVRGKTNEKVVVDYYCYSEELAGGNWLTFYKDNIKSIVTKEQFANMQYKVGEREYERDKV